MKNEYRRVPYMKKAPLNQNYCWDHKNKKMCLALWYGTLKVSCQLKEKNETFCTQKSD